MLVFIFNLLPLYVFLKLGPLFPFSHLLGLLHDLFIVLPILDFLIATDTVLVVELLVKLTLELLLLLLGEAPFDVPGLFAF